MKLEIGEGTKNEDVDNEGLYAKLKKVPTIEFKIGSLPVEMIEDAIKDIFYERKPYKMKISPHLLLVLGDDEFIDIWKNGSEDWEFIPCGRDVYNQIQERAKKLNLI